MGKTPGEIFQDGIEFKTLEEQINALHNEITQRSGKSNEGQAERLKEVLKETYSSYVRIGKEYQKYKDIGNMGLKFDEAMNYQPKKENDS